MKNESIFGEYSNGKVLIDMNKNKTEFQQYATTIHEMTHMLLTSNSNWGIFDFLLEQIIKSDNVDKRIKNKAKRSYNTVYDYSIKVQESVAVFMELYVIKRVDKKEFESLYGYYRDRNSIKYYKQYRFKELEEFLKIQTHPLAILEIAIAAMNVDLINLNPIKGSFTQQVKKNLDKYSPNHRFFRVIKYIKKQKNLLGEYNKEEIRDIFNVLQIPYTESYDWAKFSIWGRDNILHELDINDKDVEFFVKLVNIKEEESNLGLMQGMVQGYLSADKYDKCICNDINMLNQISSNSNILYLNQNKQNNSEIIGLIDTYYGKVCYTNKFYLDNINLNKDMPILIDRNHYTYFTNKYPFICEKLLFVDIAGFDCHSSKFINSYGTKKFFIAVIDDKYVVIFILGKKNEVLFNVIPKLMFKSINETFLSDFIIVNPTIDDNELFNSIVSYDDLVLFICQDKIKFDLDNTRARIDWSF